MSQKKCLKCKEQIENGKYCEECLIDIESIRGLEDE